MMVAFPLSAALISLACAAIAWQRYWQRRRAHELAWSIAFALFALGAFAEVVGDLNGWSPLLARLYYVSGAVLTVGFLGLGSLSLLLGQRLARWLPACMLALGALGVAFVFNTPVDPAKLDRGWQALEVRGTPTLWLTIAINTIGTVIVVGGALYSVVLGWRRGMPRHRAFGLIAIAAGTLLVASGGTLVRAFGNHAYLYVTMAPGVAIILLGYVQANRAAAPLPAIKGAGLAEAGVTTTPRRSDRPSTPFPALTPAASQQTPPSLPSLALPPQARAALAPAVAPSDLLMMASVPAATQSPITQLNGDEGIAPTVTIRPLSSTDVAAARTLLSNGRSAAPVAIGIAYRSEDEIRALLTAPNTIWLGAERDGRLVGLARLAVGADPATRYTARLAPLVMLDDTGASDDGDDGAALLTDVLRWADEVMGLARLDVWVYAADERARAFYERHGFVAEGLARNALFVASRHQDVLVLARTRQLDADS